MQQTRMGHGNRRLSHLCFLVVSVLSLDLLPRIFCEQSAQDVFPEVDLCAERQRFAP